MQDTELYAQVADLYLQAHNPEGRSTLIALVEAQWTAMAARHASPADAETCRLTMLAAAQGQDYTAARVWRARALARFASVGWTEGIGSILMGEAFIELGIANSDYPEGRTLDVIKPSRAALDIIDELEHFTVGPGSGIALGPSSPSQRVLRRLFHEKRGFLQLVLGDVEAARLSYDRALDAAAGHTRGQIKVRLGRLLVDYLAEANLGTPGSQADMTEELSRAAQDVQSLDLAETAAANAAVMREGSRRVTPYEIL